MSQPPHTGHRARLPLCTGLLPIERKRLPAELSAGVTLAALAIPAALGYAEIAGMPLVAGLFTLLLPLVAFALLGSSRHLVVGADSATAAIIFAALTPLAAPRSPEYVALAGVLALATGAGLLVARLFRLGFLANFLSRTVLIGFLSGVGLQIACGQLAGLFGLPSAEGGTLTQIATWAGNLTHTSLTTLAVSVGVLLVIAVGGKLAPRFPWALVVVVTALLLDVVFSLSSHGVATIGTIPAGLPRLSWPGVPAATYTALAGAAASLFIVVLAQSAATSRAYAAKYDDAFDENTDLLGLGVANLCAGLTGTFVVSGSPTKTAVVDEAGGRSQLAHLAAAAVILLVLLFLTGPLSHLPKAVLAAIVFVIGLKLVDLRGLRQLRRLRPVEFAVAVLTALTVVLLGVGPGVLLAVVFAAVAHLRHSYRPYTRLLTRSASGAWRSHPLESGAQAAPGLVVYRFGASIYYANADHFAEELRSVLEAARPPATWLCLASESIGDLDFTGSWELNRTLDALERQGVRFVVCGLHQPVLNELKRDGLLERIGEGSIYEELDDMLEAYETRPYL